MKLTKTLFGIFIVAGCLLNPSVQTIASTSANNELSSSFFVSYVRVHKKDNMYYLKDVYGNKSITLSLDSDYHYQIHYNLSEYSQIVSKGKWIKDGNLLKLYDAFLDCSFTALIGSCKITLIDFPNDVYLDYDYLPVEEKMLSLIVR